MPSARRKPLKPGMTVWLWCGGVVCRGTLERRVRGFNFWPVRLNANGDLHHAQRHRLHLCPEDARNAL